MISSKQETLQNNIKLTSRNKTRFKILTNHSKQQWYREDT